MKRSHRLLRWAHAVRDVRHEEASGRGSYDATLEVRKSERLLGEFAADGHFDREPLGNAIESIAYRVAGSFKALLLKGGLADMVGAVIAAEVFADRLAVSGRYKMLPRDREAAKACMALSEAAILDRVHRALDRVLRGMASRDHRQRLCWPQSYRERLEGQPLAEGARSIEDFVEALDADGSGHGSTEATSSTTVH